MSYAARIDVDYPAQLDRLTTAFRFLTIIPIAIILGLLTDGCGVDPPDQRERVVEQLRELGVEIPPAVAAEVREPTGGGAGGAVTGGLFAATLLMILVRQ